MISDLDHIASTTVNGKLQPLFPGMEWVTSWRGFDVLDLPAQGTYESPSLDTGAFTMEAGYLVVGGACAVLQDPEGSPQQIAIQAPGAIRCMAGASHLVHAGPGGARLLAISVATEGAEGGQLSAEPFAQDRLPWRDAIHGGGGRIGTRHLWRPEDFASSWTFVDHAVLSEGSSLGCHYHDFLEEAFIVLSGRGWMTIADQTTEIGAGNVTLQLANVGHGLYNPFAEDLDFIRIAVATPGEAFTTIDLDDDLRSRRPTEETP
jgi:mannose-6-phosphate isomerase-like protein (cupin superfamily)